MAIEYRIPLRGIKFSTNQIYAGIHWAKRKEIKDSILSIAYGFCRPVQKAGPYPVELRYKFIFGSRGLDTLNTAAMAKMFEDAFRTIGILEDDDPAHVARTILEVASSAPPRGTKKAHTFGLKANAQDEDWVEIEIKSL